MTVYFIQDSGTLEIKIGHTDRSASARIRDFQTGNPSLLVELLSIPGDESVEAELKRKFAKWRVRGEWFRPVPELLRFIIEQKEVVPAERVVSKPPYSIYLAGSMAAINAESWSDQDAAIWRTTIVPPDNLLNYFHSHPLSMEDLPVQLNAIRLLGESHHYVGPYYFDAQSGHACWDKHNHGFNDQAYGFDDDASDALPCHGRKQHIVNLCFRAIARADIVFAWIDCDDCYGTITEIGYAAALGKRIWIASPRSFPDMWFPFHASEFTWEGVPEAAGAFRDGMIRDFNRRYLADESKHLRTIYS